jgi:type VI secretion system protein ImpG
MSQALYPYYERELLFIRQFAQDFARQYPAVAGRLLLEPNRSLDPHVERLIESFALLAGRVHHKLDDEFPELTDALLSVLYPHYLAPVPSLAVVQFVADPERTPLTEGFLIPRGSRLHTPPVNGLPCKFRTAYPVTLWPVALTGARLQGPPFPTGLRPPPRTEAVLRLQLECQAGATFAALTLTSLRFHLLGRGHVIADLYELLFNHVLQVELRSPDNPSLRPVVLTPGQALVPVGFSPEEGLLPYSSRSFPGYRLLTEFFAFPAKFLFADLCGLEQARRAGFGKRLEIVLYLDHTTPALEQDTDAQAFRLGCTPIANLFEQTAEPIPLTQARYEYRVVPDVAQPLGLEVYSIDSVTAADPTAGAATEFHPFYSFHHGSSREERRAFWYAVRRPSAREGDRGTDVYLNLVDLDFRANLPSTSTLVVRTTCSNRELAVQLQRAGEQLAFELEAAAPLAAIRCLRTPTLPLRPPSRRGAYWRLLSHLSLNHLSLSDPVEGRAALQEILRLYDFSDATSEGPQGDVVRLLIDGITSVSSRRVVGRVATAGGGLCRGIEVTVEFDEEKYVGTGGFLFACVLERFLGLYASINSFSQLVARTRRGEGYLKKWPPRAGEQPLL